jgi:uncharacterized protein YbjT (DUF2867 family)
MDDRFLILGSSGLVGSHVFRRLLADGYDAVGASRHKTGEPWVYFDLLDPRTHASALAGITTVMLISRPGDEEAHLYAAPLISSMVTAGVKRVADLSALGAAKRPQFSIRKVELLVETSGLEWAHVRPNFFMQVLARPPLSTEIATRRTLSLPLGSAKVAYVDARDVAATLFRALTDRALAGQAIELNGPEAVTHDEVVSRISQRIGETVRYVDISEESARALLRARGFPASMVERVLGIYALCRQDFCSSPDTEVAQLLGRPLGSLDAFIEANLTSWKGTSG